MKLKYTRVAAKPSDRDPILKYNTEVHMVHWKNTKQMGSNSLCKIFIV